MASSRTLSQECLPKLNFVVKNRRLTQTIPTNINNISGSDDTTISHSQLTQTPNDTCILPTVLCNTTNHTITKIPPNHALSINPTNITPTNLRSDSPSQSPIQSSTYANT